MKTAIKLIVGIPVFSSLVIALIFIGLGVNEIVIGIKGIINGEIHTDTVPGIKLFLALDIFLIAFLFLIFSIGFMQLFISRPSTLIDKVDKLTPDWLKVENFTQLKLILWDTVLTTLVIAFVGEVFKKHGEYEWELIIIPLAILFISLSKFLIKAAKK